LYRVTFAHCLFEGGRTRHPEVNNMAWAHLYNCVKRKWGDPTGKSSSGGYVVDHVADTNTNPNDVLVMNENTGMLLEENCIYEPLTVGDATLCSVNNGSSTSYPAGTIVQSNHTPDKRGNVVNKRNWNTSQYQGTPFYGQGSTYQGSIITTGAYLLYGATVQNTLAKDSSGNQYSIFNPASYYSYTLETADEALRTKVMTGAGNI
jgi:hypothetical protein